MNKQIKILAAASLLVSFASTVQAFDQAALKKFESRVQPSEGVYVELNKFSSRGETLPAEYQQDFVTSLSKMVFTEKARALQSLDKGCTEYVKVNFVNNVESSRNATVSSNEAVQDFESGLIRIETAACFKKSSPSQILTVFSSPAFQDEAISTIVSAEQKGTSICENTSVISIGKSHYCYQPDIFNSESLALNHHFNSWNNETPGLIPVFFREILTSAHRTSDGVAFHMVVYIRSVKLGLTKKMFAKSSIEKEQTNSMNLLKSKLNEHLF